MLRLRQLKKYSFLSFALGAFLALGCGSNNPHSDDESEKNYYYDTFVGEPKHLDPARAYSADEYLILAQVYEPLYQYHFLKRPYELIPLTAEAVAEPVSVGGRSVYTITLKKNIRFQEHAAFAKDKNGKFIYHDSELPAIEHPNDLPHKGSRELTAADYVYQIKRLASPQISCPILPVLAKYIVGFGAFNKLLEKELSLIRAKRRKQVGILYNQEKDEKENPIFLDLRKFNMAGLRIIDKYTFQIVLTQPYPQFKYWLAMPFFAPMAWQVDKFYAQPSATRQNIILDRFPVGTGAYTLSMNRPNYRIELSRNKNFHDEFYPSEGTAEDKKNGLLADAGKKLPFIEKAIYVKETEAIPRWNKFLQGYYDNSGIVSDVFDSAVSISATGPEVTDELREKSISLITTAETSIRYFAFNMLDDVVGTQGEKQRKLRQAISIAINIEEMVQIFLNGRGIAAHGPVTPGIFGYQGGKEGLNPYVYSWHEKLNRPIRKSLKVAKRLLAEAGYPGGKDKDGKQLVLNYDTTQTGESSLIAWIRKQVEQLGVELKIRSTDYNQFRNKVIKGNYQILFWGWNADYPDPENFLFLLYGPNGKVKSRGENAANYDNPEYNRLFRQVSNMADSPQRAALIQQMTKILQRDSPWIWGFYPITYALYHTSWYKNAKPLVIGNNALKYKRVLAKERAKRRSEYNDAILWPLVLLFALVGYVFIRGVNNYRKKDKGLVI